MKFPALLLTAALAGLGASDALAQWQTVPYSLRGGWNTIYLHGEASHATLDTLLAGYPQVVSVWRWNPNPTETQFSVSPLTPSPGTPEWSVWRRGDVAGSTLTTLTGQAAYLVQCTGAANDAYTVPITQKAQPPRATWVRAGANLLGFPTRLNGANYPLFSNYFSTFPAAIGTSSKIFKYAGGDLGSTNPAQIFSTTSERLDRNRAYWFEAPVVGDFYAPLEISSSVASGIDFGRSGSLVTVLVRNRTSASVTLNVAALASGVAPAGQETIAGPVPLKRRTFVASSATYSETAVTASGFNEVIPAQSVVELGFTPDRTQLSGASGAYHASLLRFTDSGNLLDIVLPVTARSGSFAGLWVGEVSVTGVTSLAPGATGTGAVARPFPLRVLLHVNDAGQVRLLSQAFVGRLASAPDSVGVSTVESALLASAKADATRIVAAHLPPDTVVAGAGTVALGGTLLRTVVLPFDGRSNPFVHQYHPDHDNKDARGNPLPAGVESYTVTRACSFTFSPTPVGDAGPLGWGTTVLGGAYAETVTGLHKDDLSLSGTFVIRRVSESGSITLN